MIYFFILLMLISFSYNFDYQGNTRYRKQCYYLTLILLILVAGLRYRLGVDTVRYESAFYWLPPLFDLKFIDFEASSYDPLYLIFSCFSKIFSSEFWVMQLCQAILVNTVVFIFIRKNTKNIFFGILIYYLFLYTSFMCEVMREACAVSMFLLSWEYFKKNKWMGYYALCTAAFLFHSSAILLFILPVLKWLRIWNLIRIRNYTVPVLILVLVLGYTVQNIFFDYVNILSITDRIDNKINAYSNSKLAGDIFNINGILATIFRYILYPYVAIVLLKKRDSIARLDIEPMVVLCFVFALLSIPIAIFYRYNNYFMPFVVLALADLAFSKKVYLVKKRYLIVSKFRTWMLFYIPLFFIQIYGYFAYIGDTKFADYMRYYPYSSVFDKEKDKDREDLFIYYNAY